MKTLNEHLADFRTTYSAVKSESARREEIKLSPEYIELEAKMNALFADIPDSTEEYEMDRKAVLDAMNAEGLLEVPGFVIKTRTKRSVDVRGVLEAMQGDIDNLMIVASVKQTDLQKFAKENPEYKKDLRSCIIEEGVSVVDIMPA